ncbi:diacylglycerol kinase family protein [Anaerolineales bacterium HSG24]|nr:diacylglycerol kinase family protein [Anaerolineales bacterium HSG24]
MTQHKINRLESFKYAFAGIWFTLRTQRNAQIHTVMGLIIVCVGLVVGLTRLEWAIIVLTMGLVVTLETINTAIEVAMDHLTPEIHPQVKIVKDTAAGAVLLGAMTAVIVGLLLLGLPLLDLIFAENSAELIR